MATPSPCISDHSFVDASSSANGRKSGLIGATATSSRTSVSSRPAFASCMLTEQNRILRGSQFQNSPTLTRLLKWLVSESLAGRGDLIKSYTIAVEGLGRPEDFDSQADSYPRVQMVRLRKALQIHYAQQAPVQELCLYLQLGSYRARLGRLESAYPQLYRPLSREMRLIHAPEEATISNLPRASEGSSRPLSPRAARRHVLWAAGSLAGMLLIAISLQILAVLAPNNNRCALQPSPGDDISSSRMR